MKLAQLPGLRALREVALMPRSFRPVRPPSWRPGWRSADAPGSPDGIELQHGA